MTSLFILAAVPGFEPGNGGFKVRCLTAWRHRIATGILAHWGLGGKGKNKG